MLTQIIEINVNILRKTEMSFERTSFGFIEFYILLIHRYIYLLTGFQLRRNIDGALAIMIMKLSTVTQTILTI